MCDKDTGQEAKSALAWFPSILRVCVREEDEGVREAGATSDLKMPLENGCADERVSRGQAS